MSSRIPSAACGRSTGANPAATPTAARFFGDYLPRETLRRVLEEYRPRWQRQLDQGRQMMAAIGEEDRHRPPTAVLRRGVAYRELMVRWIDGVLADLERLDDEAKADREGN